jgi:predicted dehydrogenase
MKTIRAAVIGTGFIGPAHIEALRRTEGVDVVAIGSNEPERASAIAAQFGIPKVCASWEEVVALREVEVIHNCTPNNLHYAINSAALNAGKHIVSEKPLTMTARESAKLLKQAHASGLVHAINFNYRFYPLIQQARAMVKKGEVGDVYLVHGHYLQDWLFHATDYNWRLEPEISGTSRAIADIGSHWCDLIQFVTGRMIVRVCATLSTIHPKRRKPRAAADTFKGKEQEADDGGKLVSIGTEDTGVVLFALDNGAKGAVTISQVSAGRKNHEWFEIDGSTCALAWDQEDPNQLWIGHRDGPNQVVIKDPALLHPEVRKYAHYPGGHPEGFPDGPKNMFRNIYEFIRSGADPRKTAPEFPTFADGHRENCIVEAILKSNRSERWVDVSL